MVWARWEDAWKATYKRDLYGRCEWQRREMRPSKDLPLLVRFFKKVGCAVLVTGVFVWPDVWTWTRQKEYVRIVAGGVQWFLPTPMGKRREFMYVCVYDRKLITVPNCLKLHITFFYVDCHLFWMFTIMLLLDRISQDIWRTELVSRNSFYIIERFIYLNFMQQRGLGIL